MQYIKNLIQCFLACCCMNAVIYAQENYVENYAPSKKEYLVRLLKNPNIKLSQIDTSKITDMSRLFENSKRKDFSGIESWNVSNVKDMSYMFARAEFFNHNINAWDMSNVESISGMFYEAINFNQPLNNWNVSNVRFMFSVFLNAKSFNQPLNNWNVSKVEAMGSMFYGASSFNQPLQSWDTSNVKNMRDMFHGAKAFNQDISNWNLQNVAKKEKMFFRSGVKNPPAWYHDELQKEKEIESFNQ